MRLIAPWVQPPVSQEKNVKKRNSVGERHKKSWINIEISPNATRFNGFQGGCIWMRKNKSLEAFLAF